MHQARFGFTRAGEAIELVDVRAEAIGRSPITWADLPLVHGTFSSQRPRPTAKTFRSAPGSPWPQEMRSRAPQS